jgi:hypothetical protein
MKRLAWMLIAMAAAACVCATTVSAFTARDPFPFDEITATNATFGDGNVLNLTAHHGANSLVTTGLFNLTGTDANGTHQLVGTVDCMQVSDPTGAVLAHVDSSSGEPASVYGVLFQLSDPELRNTNNGIGDTIAVTMLNQRQYQRALASGCSAAVGKQSLTGGNVIVEHMIPCDNQCGGGGVR